MKICKSLLVVLVCGYLLTACLSLSTGPSICDIQTEPSYLCSVATNAGVSLEDVGVILVVANAVAIGEGAYSSEDAVEVLTELRDSLDNPISYLFFRSQVKKQTARYPGLFIVADMYLDQFTDAKIIYPFDRAILRSWLNARIRGLE